MMLVRLKTYLPSIGEGYKRWKDSFYLPRNKRNKKLLIRLQKQKKDT